MVAGLVDVRAGEAEAIFVTVCVSCTVFVVPCTVRMVRTVCVSVTVRGDPADKSCRRFGLVA